MTAHPLVIQLADIRRDRDITQAALAARIGVSQTAISYWESGARNVNVHYLTRWAAALDITLTLVPVPTGDLL